MAENDNDKPTPPVPPAPAPPPNGGNDKMPYEGRTDISDLLTWRGVGGPGVLGFGYGGGYGGGGGGYSGGGHVGDSFLSSKAHAEGTAVLAHILANRELNSQGLDRLTENFESTFRSMQFNGLSKEHTDLERRLNDDVRAIIATMNDFRAESAKCCCEAKLLATENKSEILAAIAAQGKDDVSRALDAANAELIHLRTINALDEKHGGHRS